MRSKKHSLLKTVLITCMGFASLNTLQAQSLYVMEKTKTLSTYQLQDIKCLTFVDSKCMINACTGTKKSIALKDIQSLRFADHGLVSQQASSKASAFACYPSPATHQLNIAMNTSQENANIQIVSMSGQVVLDKNFTGKKSQIDVSQIKPGLYLCKVSNDETLEINSFIKK